MTEAENSEQLKDKLWGLDFDVAKSLRYHAYRRTFWENADYITKILTTVTGTSVLVAVVGEKTFWAVILAVAVALFSAADLVLGFSNRAKRHDALYRDFSLLRLRVTECDTPSAADLVAFQRRRLEIEMEEPGIIDWLERRCSAEECLARGCEVRESWRLTQWQFWLSQFAIWPTTPPQLLHSRRTSQD